MVRDKRELLIQKILALQDENGCWNALKPEDRYYPQYNYYEPKYKSTLWTSILLADLNCLKHADQLSKTLEIMSNHFLDPEAGIYSLGKSHFPIPCLNGNMLYLHCYFNNAGHPAVKSIVRFFARYQRFDDGDFHTPSAYPYYSNRSCYGKHTCYWGIVKLLKGLSFIPREKRTDEAVQLLEQCIRFVLLHECCFQSRKPGELMYPHIADLTFPDLYRSSILEILWLMKREQVRSDRLDRALGILANKMKLGRVWILEKPVRNLIIALGPQNGGNELVTERAREIMDFYGK